MNNKSFQVDTRKLVALLLPSAIRKETLVRLLFRMIAPLTTIYRSFYQRRLNNLFYARYDSGKGNIERMLNIYYYGEYDASDKQIYISNTDASEFEYGKVYVTTDRTTDSAYVGESYIEYPIEQELFDVYVPSELYTTSAAEIAQMVSKYILPGIGFKVISK